jgi:hypothetical protein
LIHNPNHEKRNTLLTEITRGVVTGSIPLQPTAVGEDEGLPEQVSRRDGLSVHTATEQVRYTSEWILEAEARRDHADGAEDGGRVGHDLVRRAGDPVAAGGGNILDEGIGFDLVLRSETRDASGDQRGLGGCPVLARAATTDKSVRAAESAREVRSER